MVLDRSIIGTECVPNTDVEPVHDRYRTFIEQVPNCVVQVS